MKAMVLDDNKYIVDYVKKSVNWEKCGIEEVYGVYDLETAKEILLSDSVDVLILDIELTEGTGFDLLEWVTEQGMVLFTSMMTSFAEFDYAQKAIGYHCMDYLLKPVAPEILQVTVEKLVAEARIHHKEKQKKDISTESGDVLKMIFWENLLEQDSSFYGMTLEETLQEWHIEYKGEDIFTPVFIKLLENRKWDISQSLFYFILDNAFREIAQNEKVKLETILFSGIDRYFIICKGAYTNELINHFVKRIEEVSSKTLKSSCECFVGCPGNLYEISAQCGKLEEQYSAYKKIKELMPDGEEDTFMEDMKRYICDNLADVTRASIAEHFYLSPEYVSRIWSKKMGISLMDYIKMEKLERAKFLLTNSGYTISQISEMVGYPSFAYFSKIFRLSEGIQPSEYRKQRK